jgi:L-threo-3-deoxy-hexylosonate aldolase
MGEASHLSHAERVRLIKAGRKALDNAGCSHFPIIVGTGAGSTRETVELTNEAAAAGADYALVIASGYFAGALTREALKAYWVEVSQKSPIPVMIYNCKSGFCEQDIGIVYSFESPRCEWGYRFGFRLDNRTGRRMS